MKADTLAGLNVLPAVDDDVAGGRPLDRAGRAGRSEFARTLGNVTPDSSLAEADLDAEGGSRSEREGREQRETEESARKTRARETAERPPAPTWSADRAVYLHPSADRMPSPPVGEPTDGEEGSSSRGAAAGRAPAGRLESSLRGRERSVEPRASTDQGASAASPSIPAEPAAFAGERAPAAAAPLLEQAAAEPGLSMSVLSRAAHIVIGTEDGQRLELHLRVTKAGSEIRAAGALTPMIRARLVELELALAAQGVPLVSHRARGGRGRGSLRSGR